MIPLRIWLDAYSFYDATAEEEIVSPNEMAFQVVGKAELRYLDYWQWFWEAT